MCCILRQDVVCFSLFISLFPSFFVCLSLSLIIISSRSIHSQALQLAALGAHLVGRSLHVLVRQRIHQLTRLEDILLAARAREDDLATHEEQTNNFGLLNAENDARKQFRLVRR